MFQYDRDYVPTEKLHELDCIEQVHPDGLPFCRILDLHKQLDRYDLWIHRRLNEVINNKITYITEQIENMTELIQIETNKKSVKYLKKDLQNFKHELYDFTKLLNLFYFDGSSRFYS
jgi:hypothetical protein